MRYSFRRLRELKNTLNIIENYLPNKPLLNYLDNLYHPSTEDIFDTLMLEEKKRPNSFSSTLII
jgi:hypothetical protein